MRVVIIKLPTIFYLCWLLNSCAYKPAIDNSGNVTIREPSKTMLEVSRRQFEEVKKNKPISNNPKLLKRIDWVSKHMKKVIDLPHAEWEFVLFKDNSANAFCLPGGKVGIYTGIFKITGDDDALLAAVLGHEIAHATSGHADQRMQHAMALLLGAGLSWALIEEHDVESPFLALSSYVLVSHLFTTLPLTRRQEFESDRIGAIFMAKAGYDPRKTIELWRQLEVHHQLHGNKLPSFLRTHPADKKRIKSLEEFMPTALLFLKSGQ